MRFLRCSRSVIVGAWLGAAMGCAREPPPASPVPGYGPSPALLMPSAVSSSPQRGFATYYAGRFTGVRTANGERYDPSRMTAAHRSLPFGTMVEVRTTGPSPRVVVVRINDRGPYGRDRIVDLSLRAAQELGIVSEGKVAVELRVVAPPTTAPY